MQEEGPKIIARRGKKEHNSTKPGEKGLKEKNQVHGRFHCKMTKEAFYQD